MTTKCLTTEEYERRKEARRIYDRERYVKAHPNALTKDEVHARARRPELSWKVKKEEQLERHRAKHPAHPNI